MTDVIDASVLLAHILDEPGGDVLLDRKRLFHLSIVNLGEVYTKVIEHGGSIEDVDACVSQLPIRIRAFREADAAAQARLRAATRHLGLSYGDRACLATAQINELPVLTADRQWAELDIGLDIRLIR